MAVGSRDAERHRQSIALYDNVAFAALFASVRRIGTCELAPRAGDAGTINTETAEIKLVCAA